MKRNFVVSLFGSLIGFGILLTVLSTTGVVGARGSDARSSVARTNEVSTTTPLTSTFTYQGQLKDDGAAVNGSCDMAFRLYDDPSAPINLIGNPITSTVPVTNGLFTVGLNFGNNTFDGKGRWLDIQVNCNNTVFVPLPRQAVTAAPYALFATSTGALQNYPVAATAPANGQVLKWNGSTWIPGTDNTGGGGSGWSLTGNAGTTSANFLGTTDNMSLTLVVSGTAALRLVPTDETLNLISGFVSNTIGGSVNHGSTIGGGGSPLYGSNTIQGGDTSYSTISGGVGNIISGTTVYNSVIGGGSGNVISSSFAARATIGGGSSNTANGAYAFIGGGAVNTASYPYTVISGGSNNIANGDGSTVGGGFVNTASGHIAAIGGGFSNTASYSYTVVGGGTGNTASGYGTTVGGGGNNTASGNNWATISGGGSNLASGGSSVIGGGDNNTASNVYASIGGGYLNAASGLGATVSGGGSNTASGNNWAFIGGGGGNVASGGSTVVAGGDYNTASNLYATIAGGYSNIASGQYAMVTGGYSNTAAGDYSFAAGYKAWARYPGSFVWNDSVASGAPFADSQANEFNVRSSGGVRFFTSDNYTTGCVIAAGGGSWSCTSDRNAKSNFANLDGREILAQLNTIPIQTWNYKTQDASIRHIGPMAQDFYAAFNVGEDDKHISTVDEEGVALAAIQGLYQIVQDKDKQITVQQQQIDALQTQVSQLQPGTSSPPFNVFNLISVAALIGFVWMWLQQRRSKRGRA
jgi:hypothetical protein